MRKPISFFALIFGSVVLAACAQTPVTAEKEVGITHEHHHGKNGIKHNHGDEAHNHALHNCEALIPRGIANIPDFSMTNWKKIEIFVKSVKTDRGEEFFAYTFYKDTNRPEVPVAAATLTTRPFSDFTNVMWDTGEKKRIVALESRDPVCESSLYGTDGKRYDLEGFMKKISAWANRGP